MASEYDVHRFATDAVTQAINEKESSLASKYDLYWNSREQVLAFLIDAATQHGYAHMDISDIQALGNRASWRGRAVVRGRRIVTVSMAHAASLADAVAVGGLCAAHTTAMFTFTIDAGCRLHVTCEKDPPSQPGSQVQPSVVGQAVLPHHGTVLRAQSSRSHVRGSDFASAVSLDTAESCAVIHRFLNDLPVHREPLDLRFSDGLYFFYQRGEASLHAPNGRVVRVGNHPRRDGRLVGRLREHYRSRRNAKNGSVFRLLVGGALIRSIDAASPCLAPAPGQGHWERPRSPECDRCAPFEQRLTDLLASDFCFRVVRIDQRAERNHFEAVLIATLAACTICEPSDGWLGRFSCSSIVQCSGLWNREFVGRPTFTSADLERFRAFVQDTREI